METITENNRSHHASSRLLGFAKQAQRLSLSGAQDEEDDNMEDVAIAARFVTPRDAIIKTVDGERLPVVPVEEALKLNRLRDEAINEDDIGDDHTSLGNEMRRVQNDINGRIEDTAVAEVEAEVEAEDETQTEKAASMHAAKRRSSSPESHGGPLEYSKPPAHTHPLFPPLPLYGPSSMLRTLQCQTFRAVSFCLSLSFLGVIILGSCVNTIVSGVNTIWSRYHKGESPESNRPFYQEELLRESIRQEAARRWQRERGKGPKTTAGGTTNEETRIAEESDLDFQYPPLEGGHDPVVCDIRYYARRVGLDVETFKVQTEDGFILTLWQIYNPNEYNPLPLKERDYRRPDVFYDRKSDFSSPALTSKNRRYPVLLIHGLLQSAGAYCVNDDDSLAFFLCKAGYDVWLGNNRCGFEPQHKTLKYSDPRIWCWNIRHMGVLDLPAFVSRILYQTGFEKLGLVCHSQGTTEAMVALAKDQRPELGERISVFCGLAPAAYAGPLIKKAYFRFMRIISPSAFRLFFGIHAFIPFMMTMHDVLPSRLYGALGYRVFSYLFNWSDSRWDRGLRDRMFQFSPVYGSADSMRWWLGSDSFAVQKCILSTEEQGVREEEEDQEIETEDCGNNNGDDEINAETAETAVNKEHHDGAKEKKAWYGPKTPPFAFWVAGSDGLVDGRRLLRRFRNGREPFVDVVHEKIIEGYEHLDVLWAIDAVEQVGKEVAEVLWRTVPETDKERCRVPRF